MLLIIQNEGKEIGRYHDNYHGLRAGTGFFKFKRKNEKIL